MISKLNYSQQGVYLECIAHPESTQYNNPFLGRFCEDMDSEKLKAALLKTISAHPALNTTLTVDTDGQICMKTVETSFVIPVFTLSEEEFVQRKKNLVRPFDLKGERLARFEIYQTPNSLYLFEDIHHLIYDGSSTAILAKDLRRALDGLEPETEKLSAFDFAEHEAAWLSSDESKISFDYWTKLLSGCETNCIPEPDKWENKRSQAWLTRDLPLDETIFSTLRHRAGCATSAFFTTAFAYLLSVYTGQDDVLFNTIYAGRDEYNINTVGMFVRTMPFRMDFQEQGSIDAILRLPAMNSRTAALIHGILI